MSDKKDTTDVIYARLDNDSYKVISVVDELNEFKKEAENKLNLLESGIDNLHNEMSASIQNSIDNLRSELLLQIEDMIKTRRTIFLLVHQKLFDWETYLKKEKDIPKDFIVNVIFNLDPSSLKNFNILYKRGLIDKYDIGAYFKRFDWEELITDGICDSEEVINVVKDDLTVDHWILISHYFPLTEDFIRKYKDYLYLSEIVTGGRIKISEELFKELYKTIGSSIQPFIHRFFYQLNKETILDTIRESPYEDYDDIYPIFTFFYENDFSESFIEEYFSEIASIPYFGRLFISYLMREREYSDSFLNKFEGVYRIEDYIYGYDGKLRKTSLSLMSYYLKIDAAYGKDNNFFKIDDYKSCMKSCLIYDEENNSYMNDEYLKILFTYKIKWKDIPEEIKKEGGINFFLRYLGEKLRF